jgi:hypothetical protein
VPRTVAAAGLARCPGASTKRLASVTLSCFRPFKGREPWSVAFLINTRTLVQSELAEMVVTLQGPASVRSAIDQKRATA